MPPEVKEWLSVISLLIAIGGAFYAWLTSGSKKNAENLAAATIATNKAMDELEAMIDDHDKRVQKLESDFRHLPDIGVVHRLELTMKDMQVQMAGMAAAAEATARTAHRVENFLIEQAKSPA